MPAVSDPLLSCNSVYFKAASLQTSLDLRVAPRLQLERKRLQYISSVQVLGFRINLRVGPGCNLRASVCSMYAAFRV